MTRYQYELIKQAGWGASLARWAGKIPSEYGLGKFTKRMVGKATVPKPYKGILVRGEVAGQRAVSAKNYSPGMEDYSMFSPKDITRQTIGAWRDIKAPWQGKGSFGDKVKDSLQQAWHNVKYKPGEVIKLKNGKLVQNVHERTLVGKVVHGAMLSGPGVAATSYLTGDKSQSQGKRIAGAVGQGLAWGKLGFPTMGPVSMGLMAKDVVEGIAKKPKRPPNSDYYNY